MAGITEARPLVDLLTSGDGRSRHARGKLIGLCLRKGGAGIEDDSEGGKRGNEPLPPGAPERVGGLRNRRLGRH